jgi:hypothetical protein
MPACASASSRRHPPRRSGYRTGAELVTRAALWQQLRAALAHGPKTIPDSPASWPSRRTRSRRHSTAPGGVRAVCRAPSPPICGGSLGDESDKVSDSRTDTRTACPTGPAEGARKPLGQSTDIPFSIGLSDCPTPRAGSPGTPSSV